ncbi:MAG: TIGR03643 family protein [Chitinophagaceae bacterium]
MKKSVYKDLTQEETDRIIEMAWEDRTPFDAIQIQFGLTQGEVEKIMRKELKRSSFNLWRKRVSSSIGIKHAGKTFAKVVRFKCSRQRTISMNKISKR